jgi:hypothetical protein
VQYSLSRVVHLSRDGVWDTISPRHSRKSFLNGHFRFPKSAAVASIRQFPRIFVPTPLKPIALDPQKCQSRTFWHFFLSTSAESSVPTRRDTRSGLPFSFHLCFFLNPGLKQQPPSSLSVQPPFASSFCFASFLQSALCLLAAHCLRHSARENSPVGIASPERTKQFVIRGHIPTT